VKGKSVGGRRDKEGVFRKPLVWFNVGDDEVE
jgi:hypothetical protein